MGLSFLLVDDDQDAIFINEYLINQSDFAEKVYKAENVPDALALLNKMAEENITPPDVIFLDIRMPVEDGFVFLKKFKELSFHIKQKCKVVMVTSSLDKEDYHKAMANPNVIDYIAKPLTLEKLGLIADKI
jgi:response regulator of citrate/malate metabolism